MRSFDSVYSAYTVNVMKYSFILFTILQFLLFHFVATDNFLENSNVNLQADYIVKQYCFQCCGEKQSIAHDNLQFYVKLICDEKKKNSISMEVPLIDFRQRGIFVTC